MATLEIHDGAGRVQFFELSRDHPVLFGTSAACDVLLEGPGILPVHGRIRWKKGRFKVEASPDAEFVLINGHKMTTASLHQGDEMSVGPCRLFLLRVDQDGDLAASAHAVPDDGRTKVLAAPVVPAAHTGARGGSRPSARAASAREPMLENEDEWADALSMSPRRQKEDVASAPLARSWSLGRQAPSAPVEPAPARPAAWNKWLDRLKSFRSSEAPGRERIASSPLVLGLIAALLVLVGMGFWLKSIIASTIATRTFNRGVQDFDDGDYRTAIRDLDQFVAGNPQDPRVGKARVLRALANVRQYVSPEGTTWGSALEAVHAMMEQVSDLEEFRDERAELAELVIRIGEGLADRARHAADPKTLEQAESAVPLHAQVAGETAPAFLNRSRLPSKLNEARAAVRKARIRSEALATMDKALADGVAARVYDARDALLDQYADLARDKDLIAKMTAANEIIRKAVKVDPTRRAAAREPRPDPLGPPTSLVLRSSPAAAVGKSPEAPVVFALADGLGYAIDGPTGAPLWHIPLGLLTQFAPQAVPGDPTALAFDSRYNELVRLDARTGQLKWRLDLGEPVSEPPLLLVNQLAQVLPSGKLLLIELESGELKTTLNLGRPLAKAPVHDESGQHLYVVGKQDCLFVLARDPLSCVAVEYLGQTDGSIPCTPARLGQFLVIPDNESLADSRWHVLVLDHDGARVRPVQYIEVAGWTWHTPASAGPIVWATGDKGGYEAFAVGDHASKTPFRSVARLTPDSTRSGPAFALARSDRELWVASGHSGRFALDPERGSIEPKSPIAQPGPALAPIQVAGNLVVLTFQDEATGGVALLGIDADSGTIVWKTVVGAPWPAPLTAPAGSSDLSLFGRDGRAVSISPAKLAQGGFIEQVIPLPGEFVLPPGLRLQIEAGGKVLSVIVPKPLSNEIWAQDPGKPVGWRKVGLPAALAADPVVWGGGVLALGRDARAYLVDPLTARSSAEPFVPQFDRDRQGLWRRPAIIDRDTVALADQAGRVYRVELKTTPVPRLVGAGPPPLDKPIIADPVSTGGAVIVVTADEPRPLIRALAARDLSPAGSWPLEAPLAGPPVAIDDGCVVMDRAGRVIAFGRNGQRTWSIDLKAEVVGTPLVREQSIWLVTRDGKLHVCSLSDGGEQKALALGILPSGGLLKLAELTLVDAGLGTIRPLAGTPASSPKTTTNAEGPRP
jgi:outer membrane protein assembly factor BamB